jgi:glycosyltransferase involved in cell wall biosynthesis
MRVLHVVASQKWTGAAAVVWHWTLALSGAGVEAQFAFVGQSLLSRRLLPDGRARPLLSRPHGTLAALRDRRRLADTLAREAFDVVHAHLSHDHFLAALSAGKRRIRLVRTLHHLNHVRRDPATRVLFGRTDAFAFANRSIARACGAEAPVHSPVVDTELFAPGLPPQDLLGRFSIPRAFVAGTVGKIAPGRGHAEAIEAVAPLADATLLHVGKGEHEPSLRRKAERLGSTARNLWTGYQEDLLPGLYRAMSVFLFTASGSQQGQRAVLEAMACGLPVVSLPVPGVEDLVTDGVEGFVAADVPGLTSALRRLMNDEDLRRRMGEAARRRAQEFTAGKFATQAIAFYEAVLSRTGP